MPRLPSLTRDDATGVYLHRVGDRWLPLEQAHAARETRDAALPSRERDTAPQEELQASAITAKSPAGDGTLQPIGIANQTGTAAGASRAPGHRLAPASDADATQRPGQEDA